MAGLPHFAVNRKLLSRSQAVVPQICLKRPSSFKPTSKAFNGGLIMISTNLQVFKTNSHRRKI